MSLFEKAWKVTKSEGPSKLIEKSTRYFLNSVQARLSALYPSTNIFEAEWDALLILDGCRYDLMCEVAPEFDYITDVQKIGSVGSKTTEWMENTFVDDYRAQMKETAYVAGNPNTFKFVSADNFALLDEVWQYAWDDELGTIPMEPLTDRAISIGRTHNVSRLLVHYMQPHEPFLSATELGGRDTVERMTRGEGDYRSVWSRLETGTLSQQEVWNYYRDNLERVLENIKILIANLEAEKLVITSDHGNAFGEWGQYGHPRYRPIPSLRRVPWIELSAEETETYKPRDWDRDGSDEVKSRLRDLGYV